MPDPTDRPKCTWPACDCRGGGPQGKQFVCPPQTKWTGDYIASLAAPSPAPTGSLYRTDTEALDECLALMFPDLEPDDFRTDGGSINMPKVRALWAERTPGVTPKEGGGNG